MLLHRLHRFAEFHINLPQQSSTGSPPKDLIIMRALFRPLFKAFSLLFFDFFSLLLSIAPDDDIQQVSVRLQ